MQDALTGASHNYDIYGTLVISMDFGHSSVTRVKMVPLSCQAGSWAP